MKRTLQATVGRLKSKDFTTLRELSERTAEVAEVFTTEVRQWQSLISAKPPSINS